MNPNRARQGHIEDIDGRKRVRMQTSDVDFLAHGRHEPAPCLPAEIDRVGSPGWSIARQRLRFGLQHVA